MSAPPRLRVAHVTATFPPYWGGTGNVAWYNARELARLGHQVRVCTADLGGERIAPEGVRVHRLRPLARLGNAPLLPGLGPALAGADLVHLHYPFIFGAELAAAWCAARRVPLVVTYHNDLLAPGARGAAFAVYGHLVGRWVLARARRVLAVTLDHLAHSRAGHLLAADHPRVEEIPNGIDPELFRPDPALRRQLRDRLGVPPSLRLALFVGALDPAHHYRRLDLLLEAVARLARAGEPIGLAVVGAGPLLPGYREQAAGLGLADRVWFLGGFPPEVLPAAYNAADLVALPSQHQESFGMVLVEALACGTPVIASDLPGVRAVVAATGGGLLVPPGDVGALAAALAGLVADADRRAALAEAGRRAVATRYAWPSVVARLEVIYRAVLAASTTPA